jgi:hypothetical protein
MLETHKQLIFWGKKLWALMAHRPINPMSFLRSAGMNLHKNFALSQKLLQAIVVLTIVLPL